MTRWSSAGKVMHYIAYEAVFDGGSRGKHGKLSVSKSKGGKFSGYHRIKALKVDITIGVYQYPFEGTGCMLVG